MVARPPPSPPEALSGPDREDLSRSVAKALASPDPSATMGAALAELARLLRADRCTVLTPFGPAQLRVFASSDMTSAGDLLVEVERYPELGHVLDSGEPVLVRDVGSSELLRPVKSLIAVSATTSIAAVPLRFEATRGILRITSVTRPFTPADLELLRDAARVIERTVHEHPAELSGAQAWRELAVAFAGVVVEVLPDGRVAAVHRCGEGPLAELFSAATGRLLTEILEDPEGHGPAWLSDLIAGRAPRRGRALSARLGGGAALPVRAHSSLLQQLPPRALIGVRCAGRDALDGDRMFVGAPLPMLAVDGSGHVALANRAAEDRFGAPWHELVGRRLDDLIRHEPGGTFLRRPDGHEIPVTTIRSEPEDPAAGRLSVVLLVDREVPASDRRELRLEGAVARQAEQITTLTRQLDDLSRRRTIFLSAWAHELKTPLTVLQVYLETLRDDLSDGMSDEQSSFIGICHDSVLRLRRLVLDLVELAALEAGKVRFDIGRVDLDTLLAEAVRESAPLAELGEIALSLEVAGSPAARADGARVLQIIRNLLDNAIKFTAAGGEVTVRAGATGDSVLIEVADTGVGIPPDRASVIFEEFVRFHPGGQTQGSGLGLSICRRLAEALGGQISVDSQVGRGTTFAVRLPAWPEEEVER